MPKRRGTSAERPPPSYRPSTISSRQEAARRAISAMREQLGGPLSLREMARIAYVSPFHFNRVFHQVTGIPPTQFLWALRLEEAKRLLLTTTRSVTEVCFDVGYNSLGTFITRFTHLVGLSPRHLRHMADGLSSSPVERLFRLHEHRFDGLPPGLGVHGQVQAPADCDGAIFVGLFSTPIPQCRPTAGTLLTAPGPYRTGPVADGHYYVFAAALRESKDPLAYLLPSASELLVGIGERRVMVKDGLAPRVDVTLRPMGVTDPPILIALPALLFDGASVGGRLSL